MPFKPFFQYRHHAISSHQKVAQRAGNTNLPYEYFRRKFDESWANKSYQERVARLSGVTTVHDISAAAENSIIMNMMFRISGSSFRVSPKGAMA